jgi:hypothetical protein
VAEEAPLAVQGSGTAGREGAAAVLLVALACLPPRRPGLVHRRSRTMAEPAVNRPPTPAPASGGTHAHTLPVLSCALTVCAYAWTIVAVVLCDPFF